MGGKAPDTSAQRLLSHLSARTFFESDPSRRAYFRQLHEALTTGGVGARIPVVQRAVEAQSAANAQTNDLSRQQVAKAGLTGSAFDVSSQLAGKTQQSTQLAGIGPSMTQAITGQAPQAVTAATGIPGLSEAASNAQQAAAQGQAATASEVGGGTAALGAIAAALIAA